MGSRKNQPATVHRQGMPKWLVGAAAIVLLTLAAYWPVFGAGFIWDDDSYVTDNALVKSLDGLARLWIPRQTPQYYPAVFTSFWIEHQLWGLNPLGYHVVNVLLHAMNAVLVWRLCMMLKIPGAWLIGAVFAVHPIHVESVAWITERKNVLSGAFYLSAAIQYLKFDDTFQERRETASVSRNWSAYALSLVLFVLALLSKSVTCSLPAALILMMLWQRKRITAGRLLPLLPMFAIGLVLALNTAAIEREHVGADGPSFAFSFADRLLIASRALLFYPWKVIWPQPLMFIYPRWLIDDQSWFSYWPVALVVVIGAAALWSYMRGLRGPALALAFFAGTIFPALGFFNVYPMLFSFVADHFAYLASLGVIVLIVAALATLLKQPKRLAIAAGVVLPVLVVLTALQAATYRSAETVWRDTLEKNPDAWMPRNNLATTLIRRAATMIDAGDRAQADGLLTEAGVHVDRALELRPDYRHALSTKAEQLRLQGRYDEALKFAQAALQRITEYQQDVIARRGTERPRSPSRALAHHDVGRLLELLHRPDEALENYRAGLQWDPSSTLIQNELFRLLRWSGEQANLSGEYAKASDRFRELAQLAQTDEQQIDAAYRLAQLLAMCPDATIRNPEEAVHYALQAYEIAERKNTPSPFITAMLAATYASAGKFDPAVQYGEQAVNMARQLGLAEEAKAFDQQLQAYRAGKAAP